MIKKLLGILLAAAMLLTCLAACNSKDVGSGADIGEQQEVKDLDNEGGEVLETVDIVVDGVSDYVIVRGENAYISEVTASTELQKYLKQIAGVEIPIVTDAATVVEKEIIVGKTNRENDIEINREELGEDGFIIKTNGSKLYLVGGEQRGTLYSVPRWPDHGW